MPPTPLEPQTPSPHGMHTRRLLTIVATLVVILTGLGVFQWFQMGNSAKYPGHADFYQSLTTTNVSFAQAEQLANNGSFAETLPIYEKALQQATNADERLQIQFLRARAMVQTEAYAEAVPILKEIIAIDATSQTARVRALSVAEMAEIASRGVPDINRVIFKDEPFTALWVANNASLTLRHMYEYAVSIYPVAIAQLRIAQWYSQQLPTATASSSAQTKSDYQVQIAQLVANADLDIAYMERDGTMPFDLRYALLMRAILVGTLNRKGDVSFGNAPEAFEHAITAYASVGPGHDCLARYHYALFTAMAYGSAKKMDIHTILQPLMGEAYAQPEACTFLRKDYTSSYDRGFIRLVANLDSNFKSYLTSLGWTAADFSS